jgi:hypothetical protein
MIDFVFPLFSTDFGDGSDTLKQSPHTANIH